MKKLLIATLTCVLVLGAASADAQLKGWGLGAGVMDGDFAVQARKDFWLGGDVSQITGQAGVYFHGKTTFRVDTDYHFIVNPESNSRFYPLAGLDLGINSDKVKLGINLGGGMKLMVTDKLAGFLEAKFVAAGYDGFAVLGGVYF